MNATESQKTKLNRMLLKGEPMDTSILAGIADYVGAVERAVRTGQELLEEARTEIACLDESAFQGALVNITWYLHNLLDKCRAVA